jgi:hypothetical protein
VPDARYHFFLLRYEFSALAAGIVPLLLASPPTAFWKPVYHLPNTCSGTSTGVGIMYFDGKDLVLTLLAGTTLQTYYFQEQ